MKPKSWATGHNWLDIIAGTIVMGGGFIANSWLGVNFQGPRSEKFLLQLIIFVFVIESITRLNLTKSKRSSAFIYDTWKDTLISNSALLLFIIIPLFVYSIKVRQNMIGSWQNLLIFLAILFTGSILYLFATLVFGSEALWPDFIKRDMKQRKQE